MDLDFLKIIRNQAIKWHGDQKYGDEPYVVHLDEVCGVLEEFGFERRLYPGIHVTALLHDAPEDHPNTVTIEVLREYGLAENIVQDIMALSDGPGKTRKERKVKSYAAIGQRLNATIVKLADRIANVRRGGKVEMYRSEQPEFYAAIYRPFAMTKPMWDHLNNLLKFSPSP